MFQISTKHRTFSRSELAIYLTTKGFNTINAEYRRGSTQKQGDVNGPKDIADCLGYLKKLDPFLSLDLNAVFVIGQSAGAQVALGAIRQRENVRESLNDLQVRGVVSLAGILDVQSTQELALGLDAVKEYLGEVGVTEQLKEHCPLSYEVNIPHLVIHGLDDTTVPISISDKYVKNHSPKSERMTYIRLAGYDHMDLLKTNRPIWNEILDWCTNLIGETPG